MTDPKPVSYFPIDDPNARRWFSSASKVALSLFWNESAAARLPQ